MSSNLEKTDIYRMAASPCDSRSSEWKGCCYNYTGKLDLEANNFQSSEMFGEAFLMGESL